MDNSHSALPVIEMTDPGRQHFFGYYDKCPWNASGRYLLAHQVDIPTRMLTQDDAATLGLIDLEGNRRFTPLAETHAWHWQQGAMLQWWPGEPEGTMLYNVRREDRFGCCLQDIVSGTTRELPLPVAAVSHDGKYALSLNFSRLADERPGYGYEGLADPWAREITPAEDGIRLMNMETGEHELILSLAQIAAFESDETMSAGKHWFNHLMFSPDDKRFIFLHRWRRKGGENDDAHFAARRHYTRMFTANADGSGIYCLNQPDMTSHFCWRDANHVLAFARQPGKGDHYFLFEDRTANVELIGERTLSPLGDGHCTYSPDGRWVLTDTYPDKDHQRLLLLYDPVRDVRTELGRFYSEPSWPTPCRCDLHPRWNRDGRSVCFDSSHIGSRRIYLLDI